MQQDVRHGYGPPTASAFGGSATGSPLYQDMLNGRWWALGVGDTPFPLHVVNVRGIGVKGDGSTDDTTKLNAALDTGEDLWFPAGTYKANNLTQGAASQRLYGSGDVRIVKNANGPLFTSSASDVQLHGISFRGDAASPTFTGDNVVASGNQFALINCGSRWAYGRAVKATGSHVQILQTCDIYQTADATASGWDIEIGASGALTTYHELHGIRSGQATGGILLTDTGSHTIKGGQFGKLKIAAGTSPAGVNGGKTIGARILGATDINVSNAIVTDNQFGAVAVSLGAGTSGCIVMANAYQVGATLTNNGNANNWVERQVSTGSYDTRQFGGDASLALMRIYPVDGEFRFPIVNAETAYRVNGTKVIGAQGAAVADATGAGDVVAQLNAFLARARAHGWIAT